MSDGPYLFDVGVLALAHAGTPVSDRALTYVRRAIEGDIAAIVPYSSLVGAHHILTNVYSITSEDASALMDRFMDARRIHWHGRMPEETVRSGFDRAGTANVDGWDGFYSQLAVEEGVETILTIDNDFERFTDISTTVILSPDEFATLNDYVG